LIDIFPFPAPENRRRPTLQDRVMSSKLAIAPENLLDELQATLAHGTVARRVETLTASPISSSTAQ